MVLSLIGPLDNHRVHRVLLVAAYAGTKLKVVPITIGCENETESYRRNCHPLGRVPTLKSDEGYLFETNAIIRYLARTERPYGADGGERYPSPQHPVAYMLYGKSVQEAAEVDAWLDFVLTELDPHLFPLLAAQCCVKGRRTTTTTTRATGTAAVVVGDVAGHEAALKEGLSALEERVALKKQLLRSLAGGGCERNSAAPAFAKTATEAEAEIFSLDDDFFADRSPRESIELRGYHTYNIKTSVDLPVEVSEIRNSTTAVVGTDGAGIFSSLTPRAGEVSPRPRLPTQHSRAATPRASGKFINSDMIFLVGNSLTAADLVVALVVNQALSLKNMSTTLKQQFPQLVRFHSNILRLPLAVEMRKALGINII